MQRTRKSQRTAKHRRILEVLPLTLLVLAACDGRRAPCHTAAIATGREAFCVALLTPGPISDLSWNGSAYQGLLRIRDSLGAHVSHVQIKTPADIEEQFREYGARGFDLVIGHGFEFQDVASRVAPQYPRTLYLVTGGTTVAANIAGMRFGFADGAFRAGQLAGRVTRSGSVGMIGGTELPPVKESFDAFERGVLAANPTARVARAFVGNWEDVGAGKELALAQIGRGADVIFQSADAAGLGVFQAARGRSGVYVIGSSADQNSIAPEVTLASVVIDLPHAFVTLARAVKAGTFKPIVVRFGAESGVVRVVINPMLRAKIPPEVAARVP